MIFDTLEIDKVETISKEFSPKPRSVRMRDLMAMKEFPLSYFKNESPSWKKLQEVIRDYMHYNYMGLNLETGPFIAGGSLVRAIKGLDTPSDVDIWCIGERQFESVVARLKAHGERSSGDDVPEWREKINFKIDETKPNAPVFIYEKLPSANPDLDLFDERERWERVTEIQVCKMSEKFNPYDVLMSFDFFAAMWATDGKSVITHKRAIKDLSDNKFTINYDCGWGRKWDESGNLKKRIDKYEGMGLELREQFDRANVIDRYRTTKC